jgi:hypothetical protein
MHIYPLSRIHNTNLVRAYLGLDKHECESLEYLFIYLFTTSYFICANASTHLSGLRDL